jgi:hypothetical protein
MFLNRTNHWPKCAHDRELCALFSDQGTLGLMHQIFSFHLSFTSCHALVLFNARGLNEKKKSLYVREQAMIVPISELNLSSLLRKLDTEDQVTIAIWESCQ